MERSKIYLKQEFRDGETPTGGDFGDLIDSFMSKVDDAVDVDANGNLDIPGGLNLGDATSGQTGTLRFNSGQVQFFNGSTWTNVGGGSAGAFTPVAGGPSVAFAAGNVGIGSFAVAPTNRFEVTLGAGNVAGETVRIGNAIISNGPGASQSAAQFSNQSVINVDAAAPNANFALRQAATGEVNLNAPLAQSITLSHNRTVPRLYIVPTTGQVIIASNTLLQNDATMTLQVSGQAGKTQGGNTWATISDGRFKKDVTPFEDGLEKLMKVRPVKFRYNGKMNTNPNVEEVGVIGQDIGKIFPYMTSLGTSLQEGKSAKEKDDEVLMFNSHALTYVMVNAIQELAQKVKHLESALDKKGKH